MQTPTLFKLLQIEDPRAMRVARMGVWLSLPMWLGFLGGLSFLDLVPGMEGLGFARLAGLWGFLGFSGFLGLLGVATTIDQRGSTAW